MKFSIATLVLLAAAGCDGFSVSSSFTQPSARVAANVRPSYSLSMISDGSDRRERQSLDISKTTYTALVKAPKDAYLAFAEKGMSNAKMHWVKILHQSILGGCFVGFGGLLALSVAGNMAGIVGPNPGLGKMTFAALFPVNLLLILMTGGQLFTGNSSTVTAARFEKMITNRQLWMSLGLSLAGNVIGCTAFAYATQYCGLLTGGTAALAVKTAVGKCSSAFGPTLLKAVLCNWMVSLAVFMAGASNDLAGKLVGCWFPISTFVAIGLEHSIANLYIMPLAMLAGAGLSLSDVIFKNLIPVIIGNGIAGGIIVAASYSYQFGQLGRESRERFRNYLKSYETRKKLEAQMVTPINGGEAVPVLE